MIKPPAPLVFFEDAQVYQSPGTIYFPKSLSTIHPYLHELVGEEIKSRAAFEGTIEVALSLIMGRFTSIHNAHLAAHAVHLAYVEDRAPYALYLRSFWHSGGDLARFEDGLHPIFAWIGTDSWMRAIVKSALGRTARPVNILSFINDFDIYPSPAQQDPESVAFMEQTFFPSFRLLTHNWEEIVRATILDAHLIVVVVADDGTGLQTELDMVLEQQLATRTIVLITEGGTAELPPGDYYAVIRLPHHSAWDGSAAVERLAAALTDLAERDQRPPVRPSILADLPCFVIDKNIQLARGGQLNDAELAAIPYGNFIPRSLWNNWEILFGAHDGSSAGFYTDMITSLKHARGDEDDASLMKDTLWKLMYQAVTSFVLATTLEHYEVMALSVSSIGWAHAQLSHRYEIAIDCYRHAVTCAELAGDAQSAAFYQAGLTAYQELSRG